MTSHGNDKTTYDVCNFFETEGNLIVENDEKQKLIASKYAILNQENMLSICNVNFSKALADFKEYGNGKDNLDLANDFLLNLLSAYDRSDPKREDVLKTAHDFSD